jgi:hypothetical protein
VTVLVPVLLMLGSVYLHTVSAGLAGGVAELSGADRIRSLAAEKLGMQDPNGADLKVYDRDGEDGTRDGGEEKGGKPR